MDLSASLGVALMLVASLLQGVVTYQTWPGRPVTNETRERAQQLRAAAAIAAVGGAVLIVRQLFV